MEHTELWAHGWWNCCARSTPSTPGRQDTCVMPVTLEAIDITLIALYFVGMAAVGIIFWARGGGDGGGQDEAESFFLAGRSMRWPAVGLSLFVSNVGSEHLLGLAGSASATGVACAYFEWSAALHLLLLGWLFAPVYS